MSEEKVRKAEYPLNSQGMGYRSTLENGPYFKEDVSYTDPIDNYNYAYCGACAFYRDGNCEAIEENVHILAACNLYINMFNELDLRHQQYVLIFNKAPDEGEIVTKEVVEVAKYISEEGGKYCVRSHQTGKNFGCYSTRAAAEKRLAQISRFKGEALQFEVKFAGADEEKKLVYGIVLVPNDVDLHEEAVNADEVEKAAHGYMKSPMVIGDGHVKKAKAYPVESYIYNPDMLKDVKKGSWIMAVKVKSDVIWEGIKNGDYTGLSIGALVRRSAVEEED